MIRISSISTFAVCMLFNPCLHAVSVGNDADLRAAIVAYNSGGDSTITFGSSFSISTNPLPWINPASSTTLTINGGGNTLTGSGLQAFTLLNGDLNVNNLTIGNSYSTGSNGTNHSGGGAGLGGALFVYRNTASTVTSCDFQNNQAKGGRGATTSMMPGGGWGGS